MEQQNTTAPLNGSNEPLVDITPSGANASPDDASELRRKLIYALPGKYRLISTEEYLRKKHDETARESK